MHGCVCVCFGKCGSASVLYTDDVARTCASLRRRFDWENPKLDKRTCVPLRMLYTQSNTLTAVLLSQYYIEINEFLGAYASNTLRNNNGRDKNSEKPMTIESIFRANETIYLWANLATIGINATKTTKCSHENKKTNFEQTRDRIDSKNRLIGICYCGCVKLTS